MSEKSTPPADETAPIADPAPRRSWRERLRRGTASGGSRTFGIGALIAGALAGLVIGGLGGTAIGAALSDDDHDHGDRFGRVDRGLPGFPGGDGHGGFGPGRGGSMPAPPTDAPESTPPNEEDDDSSAS